MRCRRKRPAMCARTTWPLSSSTEKVVLGKTCLMLPKTSIGASFTFAGTSGLGGRGPLFFLRVLLRIAMNRAPSYLGWATLLHRISPRATAGPGGIGAGPGEYVLTARRRPEPLPPPTKAARNLELRHLWPHQRLRPYCHSRGSACGFLARLLQLGRARGCGDRLLPNGRPRHLALLPSNPDTSQPALEQTARISLRDFRDARAARRSDPLGCRPSQTSRARRRDRRSAQHSRRLPLGTYGLDIPAQHRAAVRRRDASLRARSLRRAVLPRHAVLQRPAAGRAGPGAVRSGRVGLGGLGHLRAARDQYHETWLVNSAAHTLGYRSFNTPDKSTNCWWVALISWGEGWHNNHHAMPFSARHGLRWFELDITWWHVRILSFLHLADRIRVPSKAVQERFREITRNRTARSIAT